MSAFNSARYNLAKYNVSQGSEIWAEGKARITFGFSHAGLTHFVKGNAAMRINADRMILDRGWMAAGTGAMTFSNSSTVNRYFWRTAEARVYINGEINLSQEAYVGGNADNEFDAELNLSQDAALTGPAEIVFDKDINLSQIAYAEGDAGEIFAVTADVISLSQTICEFPGLILRPGQTLVIDAGSYNVLLDGENAIHLQQGEWLDNLNRNTQSITISATGISRVTAEVLYTERYL